MLFCDDESTNLRIYFPSRAKPTFAFYHYTTTKARQHLTPEVIYIPYHTVFYSIYRLFSR